MNDKLTNIPNPDEEAISRKLTQVAEQTHASGQFAAALEEKLRSAHQPKAGWFSRFAPVLPWAVVIIVLGLILSWSIKSLVPAPQPAINNTPITPVETTSTPLSEALPDQEATPVVQEGGYEWRQTKLYLNVPLPQSPVQANVYSLKDEQPATTDMTLDLARRFGVPGDVFQVPGRSTDQTGYMVTDGKQRMYVQSAQEYAYYADYAAYTSMSGARDLSDDQAVGSIDLFLKSHGLDFPFRIINPQILPGMFSVLQLTPDGMPVYHDHSMPVRIDFTLGENGQVLLMAAYLADYESAGTYAIRTAEEAFQQVLNQSNGMENGVLETVRSAGVSGAGIWMRSYPDNRTITIYGQPAYYPSPQSGGAPYVGIGQYTATGNTNGMDAVDSSTYIQATGQFITENGIRKFNVETWKVTDAQETMPAGSLRQEGDRIILSVDDGSGEYIIEDAPAGLPLNTGLDSYLAVHGFLKDGQLHWDNIQYFPAGSGGGGGGGGGTGFYKLNLSGTPVPFPTPTAQADVSTGPYEYTVVEGDTCGSIASTFNVSIQSLILENNLSSDCLISLGQLLKIPGSTSTPSIVGQRIEGIRGTLMVTIHKQVDGNQRVAYELYSKPDESPFFYVTLQGNDAQELEAYHNRPIDIWGTVTGVDQNGMPQVQVERYEIPYPDIQFQILTGTQKAAEVEGERVALFTTSDGNTYVQFTSNGFPDITMPAAEGSEVLLQTLAIPGESFGGYPALRVFDGAAAVNPKNGQPTEFTGSAGQLNIIDESVQPGMENYVPPELTIESVELVYYVPDARMNRQNTGPGATYLQPAWRFFGYYSDGSEAQFLVQALKQEFLLPELEPYSGPG